MAWQNFWQPKFASASKPGTDFESNEIGANKFWENCTFYFYRETFNVTTKMKFSSGNHVKIRKYLTIKGARERAKLLSKTFMI